MTAEGLIKYALCVLATLVICLIVHKEQQMFEKEAEESFNGKKVLYKSSTDKHSYTDGFKDGYTKAKDRIANDLLDSWCRNKDDYCPHLKALEAQIEKMKCCENCRRNTPFFFCDDCTRFRGPLSPDAVDCWELKED